MRIIGLGKPVLRIYNLGIVRYALSKALPRKVYFLAVKSLGVEAVEFGVGAYVKAAHIPTDELLSDHGKLSRLKRQVEERGMVISAISVHGNPLHPQPAYRACSP